MDDFSLRPDHRSASAPLDSDEEDSVSADASFRSGFESANTSLVSGVRIAEADTSAISDVSDADYESAAEATDHDVSFDGEKNTTMNFVSFQSDLKGKTFFRDKM